ncbi:MAG: A/G-specific adenine glycosylase, partial [Candidatus Omnitrophica bacterium]|nr:A/G-specific adenine glycosylase [Candidatus Omnitrophota bacterium]
MTPKRLSFAGRLNRWYRKNARDLPWRQTGDPYQIWISEVMLQQTTVKAVIPYFERWIKIFPTLQCVAACSEQKLLNMWQGLGYYQRARNLHRAAKIISEQFDGKMPSDYETLRRLPGFGPYTTGAVLSIAYDQRVPIIDANVRRVLMRWMGQEGKATPTQDPLILKCLDRIMPGKNLRTFNQALMELGALVCKNREPVCNVCPVYQDCQAFAMGTQEVIPAKDKKSCVELDVAIAVARKNGRYFIQQRPAKGLLADLWEFPGGKIEAGESARQALIREVREELGIEVFQIEPFMKTWHFYTKYKVRLNVFSCRFAGTPRPQTAHRWISKAGFKNYPMPSGSAKIVD